MKRVGCPQCGKVNQDSRSRCMYCEASLAGAQEAGGDVPEYLRGRRRRGPWGAIFLLLLLAGGGWAAYTYAYVPYRYGRLVQDTPIAGSQTAEFVVGEASSHVTVKAEFASGSGSLVIEPGGIKQEGSSPLQVARSFDKGAYRVRVESPSGGRLRIWIK